MKEETNLPKNTPATKEEPNVASVPILSGRTAPLSMAKAPGSEPTLLAIY
jgi:hypothetical protein